jgi:hypothetical protein
MRRWTPMVEVDDSKELVGPPIKGTWGSLA